MALIFTTAPPERLAEVDRLIRSAFTPYIRALGREIAPEAYGWFAEAIVKGDIFMTLDGTEMVGTICTKPHETDLELSLIGVSPARQKSGIASFMIGEVEKLARRRGLATLSLNTAEMMEDRVRLYSRHGFEIVRRGPPDHGKDEHVRVYMEKTLVD
jgi:ribosomal protein S18 acetylase RimI-like enzyme